MDVELIEALKEDIWEQYKVYMALLDERERISKEVSKAFLESDFKTKTGFLKKHPNKEYAEIKSKCLAAEKKFRTMTTAFYVMKSANVTIY